MFRYLFGCADKKKKNPEWSKAFLSLTGRKKKSIRYNESKGGRKKDKDAA